MIPPQGVGVRLRRALFRKKNVRSTQSAQADESLSQYLEPGYLRHGFKEPFDKRGRYH